MIVYLPGSGTRCLRHNLECNGWSYSFEEYPPTDPPKLIAACVKQPLTEPQILDLAWRIATDESLDSTSSQELIS